MRSPMVPPIDDSTATKLTALSLVILSNVGESRYILTNFSDVLCCISNRNNKI